MKEAVGEKAGSARVKKWKLTDVEEDKRKKTRKRKTKGGSKRG